MDLQQSNSTVITGPAFAHFLNLYPKVQNTVYKEKIKDGKKLLVALQNHDWRYDELPALINKRRMSSPIHLEKDEIVRLTQWKIVHGQNRPFLPGMVKKNDPIRVNELTKVAFASQASATYRGTDLPDALDKGLRGAAELHGVGPATATLICSIYDPTNVAFFEDELAEWLCPDIPKLKYTWAEYKMLFTELMKLRNRLGHDHRAVDVEKVAYVIGHLDVLDKEQVEAEPQLTAKGNGEGKSKPEARPEVTSKPKSNMISPRETQVGKVHTTRPVPSIKGIRGGPAKIMAIMDSANKARVGREKKSQETEKMPKGSESPSLEPPRASTTKRKAKAEDAPIQKEEATSTTRKPKRSKSK